MILSFRHRFLFARPRKVAGTSVEMALSTLCGDRDIGPPMIARDERLRQRIGGFCGNACENREDERVYLRSVATADDAALAALVPPRSRFAPHMAVDAIIAETRMDADEFRIVGLCRHPYARVISFLHMNRHLARYRGGGAMAGSSADLADDLDRARAAGGLERLKAASLYAGYDVALLRYETLARDLADFAALLGSGVPALPHAKQGATADAADARALFRDDQIAWLNAYFAEDFARFGYAPD